MRVNAKTTLIAGLILALLVCLGHAGAVARAPEMQSTASPAEAGTARPTRSDPAGFSLTPRNL